MKEDFDEKESLLEEPAVIYDLKKRLENFAAEIIKTYNVEIKSFSKDYLAKQLIRSSCSAALNYSEALGSGTDRDRINKLRICLKELRESETNINIQILSNLNSKEITTDFKNEIDQLIRIVVTRIKNIENKK